MSLGLVSPLLNRGVRSRWLASLPGAGTTKMLVIDSSGDTSFQDIPVAAWGSITGTLSAQTDLQNALNAKLSLTGGTLTGGLSGTTGTFSNFLLSGSKLNITEYSSPYIVSIRASTVSSAEPLLTGYPWHFAWVDDIPKITIQCANPPLGIKISSDSFFAFTNSTNSRSGTVDLSLVRDASNTLGQRNSTNAQRFNLYGTYTDASNYRRLYLSSTTAGAFTLGVEGAGTGASNNTLNLVNDLNSNSAYRTSSGFGWKFLAAPSYNPAQTTGLYQAGNGYHYWYSEGSVIMRWHPSGITEVPSLSVTGAISGGAGTFSGAFTITQPVSTSGSPTAFTLTGAAHTTLTASTEATDVNFNLARTVQFAAGALTTQRAFRIQAPTYSFASASTITTASTLSISGRPISGTNATITDGYALNVESGNTILNGDLIVGVFGATTSRISFNRGVSSTYDMIQSYPEAIIFRRVVGGVATGFAKLEYALNEFGSYTGGLMLSVGGLSWNSGNAGNGHDIPNLCVMRDAADILAQRRSTNSQTFRLYNTITDASNYIRQSLSFTTYSSTVHAQLAAEGAGTGAVNVPFVITPRGTGAFILGPMPDGTATGGNARGANAVDLQTTRSAATQVASGTRAIAIGTSCTASAVNAIAIGRATASGGSSLAIGTDSATASGAGSIAIGFDSITASAACSVAIGASGASSTADCAIAIGSGTASRVNEVAWGFRHTAFDVRPGSFLLSATTTNNTATALQLQNIFGSSNFTTRTGVVLHGTLHVTGVKSDGSAVAIYTRRIVLKNVGGTITLVESQTIGTDYEDNALTDLTISATSPFFQVTGITGETWKWAAWFSPTCEIAY